jgi:hypothetical protein
MRLNLLCVGDIVGTSGRNIFAQALPRLTATRQIACNIVNAENAASGSGLTPALYEKLVKAGAHLITMGDHIYRRKEIMPLLDRAENIVRPANLPPGAPGREIATYQTEGGPKVAVISLLGRLFMKMPVDCPFRTSDRVLRMIPEDVKIVVIDVHAEATSEKVALGWYLDGRVSVVFGTHTHVTTADECILPRGTAYITDLGMTGPHDSVLGRMKDRVLSTMISGVPSPFDVAEGDARLNGIVVSVDSLTGRALSIERVRVDEASFAV